MAILGAIPLDLDTTVVNIFDAGSSGSINATTGRSGGNSYRTANAQGTRTLLATQVTLNVACAWNPAAFATSNNPAPFQWLDAGSTQVALRVLADGTIQAYRGAAGTGTLLGSSAVGALVAGIYQHIEGSVTISATVGVVQVWVNSVSVLNLTSQNTKNTANTTVSQFTVGTNGVSGTNDFSDIIYATTRINDCRVECRVPTGTGTNAAFTPSTAVANWTTVDEVPPNTTDYNETATVNAIDSFAHQALAGTPASIVALIVNVRALNTVSGAGSIAPFVRSSSTDSPGTAVSLSTSYQDIQSVYETDPATSAAWATAAVNAAEIGYKKTV